MNVPGWLDRLLPFRARESSRALLAFLLFFLVIFGYYILKPVRDSFFLEKHGWHQLPRFYLTTAVVILGVARLYQALVDRLPRHRLALLVYGVAVGSLVCFWGAFRADLAGTTAVFFVWLGIFNLFVVLMFWTLANDVFAPEDGKRLYGFVGAGGIAGGMAGGFLVDAVAVAVGTANLLLVAAAIWSACGGVAVWLHRVAGARGSDPSAESTASRTGSGGPPAGGAVAAPPPAPISWAERWRFLRDPYALWIAMIVTGGTFLGAAYDLEFKRTVGEWLTLRDARTAYFGYIGARIGMVGILVQFFVTPIVHRNFGPGGGLVVLPTTYLAGLGVMGVAPELAALGMIGILIGAFAYSIQQSSKELLYTATSRDFRYKAKAVLDTFCFRLGEALVSILAMACAAVGLSLRWLWVPGAMILVAWYFAAWWLGREFRRKAAMESKSAGADPLRD